MILKELLNRGFEQWMIDWGTTQGWFNLHGLRRKLYTPEHLKADLKLAVEIFSKLETDGLIISSVRQEFYEEMEYEEGDCEVAIPTGKVDVTEYIVLLPPGACANSCDDIVEYEIGKDGNITREPTRHVCDILYAMLYICGSKEHLFLNLNSLEKNVCQADKLKGYLDERVTCLKKQIYFPVGLLAIGKVKELYLLLRNEKFIEESVTEEDFLQVFGYRKSTQSLAPIKWLKNNSEFVALIKGIYSKRPGQIDCSQNKILEIAKQLFVGKDGEPYKSMKGKNEFSYDRDKVNKFLATLAAEGC